MDAELQETIGSLIESKVAESFMPSESILQYLQDCLEDEIEFSDEMLQDCQKKIDDAIERLVKRQANWRTPTDNDLLDQAFEKLEQQGIVARQNFTCCQTCGHYEIGEEIEEAEKSGTVIGYTFYHQQDTESAVGGGGIYLAYGAIKEEDCNLIPKKVVETLQAAGLKVDWNGDLGQRIAITDFDWKRRWDPSHN